MSETKATVIALLRGRTGAVLVALQIAIALAVLVNAAYIVRQHIGKMNRPSGVDEQNLFVIWADGFTKRFNALGALREDIVWLRSLPGVIDATPTNSAPFVWSNWSTGLYTRPDRKGHAIPASRYEMDEHGLHTLGVRLVAGRVFTKEEILPPPDKNNMAAWVPEIIVTRSLAVQLFPHATAVGKIVYRESGNTAMIIGIVNDVAAPAWPIEQRQYWSNVIFEPRLFTLGNDYLVRTAPGQRDKLMRIAEQHFSTSNPDRVVFAVRSLEYFKSEVYREDRNMTIFLLAVTLLVVGISCLGVFSLASFNVALRTKQIGTRRAVGARRIDIIRYFLVENAMVVSAGLLVGSVLALAIGYELSVRYLLPRLNLYYLVGGVLLLSAVGQLAAWLPAHRAANVPPSVATRTV